MIDSSSRKHLNSFRELTLNFKDFEANVEDKNFSRSSTNSHERFLDTFNEIYNIDINNDHDDLSILKKLLFNVEKMRKFKQSSFNSEQN